MPPAPLEAYTLIGGEPHRTTFTQGGSGSQGAHLDGRYRNLPYVGVLRDELVAQAEETI